MEKLYIWGAYLSQFRFCNLSKRGRLKKWPLFFAQNTVLLKDILYIYIVNDREFNKL